MGHPPNCRNRPKQILPIAPALCYSAVMKPTLTQIIDEAGLRSLYEDQLLSETDIATKLGTRQVYIGRLRKLYGIPTMTQGERALKKLPALTDVQRQVLVGSLLGDGSMSATSGVSARFQEGHCEEQAGYTEWKADILAPFTSSRFQTVKHEDGKTFLGSAFATTSCPQLRPLYDMFYPLPERVRVFPPNLSDILTPLALAVWYMDDGSVNGGNTRIAFGLDDTSLKRAMKALRKLGLDPKVYGEGGDRSIEFMGQTREFLVLVGPHILPCMRYKLPVETVRQKVDANARHLTPNKAGDLAGKGLTVRQISSLSGVGASTVRRRLREAGVAKRKPGRKPKGSVSRYETLGDRYPDTSLWGALPRDQQQEWVEDVLMSLRQGPFPFPPMVTTDQRDHEMSSLRGMGDELTKAVMGLKLCYPFFPNRYQARYQGKCSAYEAWYNDTHLMAAIKWQFRVGDPVTPSRVLRAVCANVRTPTVFRPAVAKALYQRYCPPGGTVWDPCAGFGGRLVGAVAAGVRYVGTDVAPETVEGNLKLAEWLGASQVDVHLADAAVFVPPPVDMVFTSPPYFQQEQYAGGDQSWKAHTTFEGWVEGFLRPMVQRGADALVPGGHWVMNIADVRVGRSTHLLVDTARRVLQDAGLGEVTTLSMPLSNLNRRVGGEPVLVWQKKKSVGG